VSQPVAEHMKVQDVAKALSVSVGKVHRIISDGDLPAVNIGNGSKAYWRISRKDFDQYLADQRAKTARRFGRAS